MTTQNSDDLDAVLHALESRPTKSDQCPLEYDLIAYSTNTLEPQRRREIETHAHACDYCTAALERYARVQKTDTSSDTQRGAETENPVETEQPTSRPALKPAPAPSSRTGYVAAGVLVLGGLLWWLLDYPATSSLQRHRAEQFMRQGLPFHHRGGERLSPFFPPGLTRHGTGPFEWKLHTWGTLRTRDGALVLSSDDETFLALPAPPWERWKFSAELQFPAGPGSHPGTAGVFFGLRQVRPKTDKPAAAVYILDVNPTPRDVARSHLGHHEEAGTIRASLQAAALDLSNEPGRFDEPVLALPRFNADKEGRYHLTVEVRSDEVVFEMNKERHRIPKDKLVKVLNDRLRTNRDSRPGFEELESEHFHGGEIGLYLSKGSVMIRNVKLEPMTTDDARSAK